MCGQRRQSVRTSARRPLGGCCTVAGSPMRPRPRPLPQRPLPRSRRSLRSPAACWELSSARPRWGGRKDSAALAARQLPTPLHNPQRRQQCCIGGAGAARGTPGRHPDTRPNSSPGSRAVAGRCLAVSGRGFEAWVLGELGETGAAQVARRRLQRGRHGEPRWAPLDAASLPPLLEESIRQGVATQVGRQGEWGDAGGTRSAWRASGASGREREAPGGKQARSRRQRGGRSTGRLLAAPPPCRHCAVPTSCCRCSAPSCSRRGGTAQRGSAAQAMVQGARTAVGYKAAGWRWQGGARRLQLPAGTPQRGASQRGARHSSGLVADRRWLRRSSGFASRVGSPVASLNARRM